MISWLQTPIIKWLAVAEPRYVAKLQELRTEAERWLAYVPASFPHYTNHTITHSEEIIRQVSALLSSSEEPFTPVLESLTPLEVYIICASAFLHDAGMVCSDSEKKKILSSDEWRAFAILPANAERLEAINQSRAVPASKTSIDHHFAADLQLRLLIAEFLRKAHPARAANLARLHQASLGRFGFDDLQLVEAIASVCNAHGLSHRELDDPEEFPERRTILGQVVNLRFCAIILRLGDLLDMQYSRACPLIQSVAAPLPPESEAHWTQYRRIRHFDVRPDKIEIRAECETADEHRVLRDWCQWIVDECAGAALTMLRSDRHSSWRPPSATTEGRAPTIKVRPAKNAVYKPVDWRFEFDESAVVKSLINSVHSGPFGFAKELLQNAVDATRRRVAPGPQTSFNENYPIRIMLDSIDANGKFSSFTITDSGAGMNADHIQRFFLQIGKSYYSSPEFLRENTFTPIGRFGIGFLTCFSVSDDVVVDTWNGKSEPENEPVRISLTGPRNYLLVERSDRHVTGTTIKVVLRENMSVDDLTKYITTLCRFVEFPVDILVADETFEIRPEVAADFILSARDPLDHDAAFSIRSLPIGTKTVNGTLYWLVHEKGGIEDWMVGSARNARSNHFLGSSLPELPDSVTCLNGIAVGGRRYSRGLAQRLDYRGSRMPLPLSKDSFRKASYDVEIDDVVAPLWSHHLERHLFERRRSVSPDDYWRYCQRGIALFPSDSWEAAEGAFPLRQKGRLAPVSFQSLSDMDEVCINVPLANQEWITKRTIPPSMGHPNQLHLEDLSSCVWFDRILGWHVKSIKISSENDEAQVVLCPKTPTQKSLANSFGKRLVSGERVRIIESFGNCPAVSLSIAVDYSSSYVLFNSSSLTVAWLRDNISSAEQRKDREDLDRLMLYSDKLLEAARYGLTGPLLAYQASFTEMASDSRITSPPGIPPSAGLFLRSPHP